METAARVATGPGKTKGVVTAGETFDARDFLESLKREDIDVEIG